MTCALLHRFSLFFLLLHLSLISLLRFSHAQFATNSTHCICDLQTFSQCPVPLPAREGFCLAVECTGLVCDERGSALCVLTEELYWMFPESGQVSPGGVGRCQRQAMVVPQVLWDITDSTPSPEEPTPSPTQVPNPTPSRPPAPVPTLSRSPTPAPTPSSSATPSFSSPTPTPTQVDIQVAVDLVGITTDQFNTEQGIADFIEALQALMNSQTDGDLQGTRVISAVAQNDGADAGRALVDIGTDRQHIDQTAEQVSTRIYPLPRRKLLQGPRTRVIILCRSFSMLQADAILTYFNRNGILSRGSIDIQTACQQAYPDLSDPVDVDHIDSNYADPPEWPPLTLVRAYTVPNGPVTVIHRQKAAGGGAPPGQRVLFATQEGIVYRKEGTDTQFVQALDLQPKVYFSGERGLLGLAVHPEGDRVFIYYVTNVAIQKAAIGDSILSQFQWTTDRNGIQDGTIDPASEVVVFTQAQPYSNHQGGKLVFDTDGNLLLFLGDGGSSGDPHCYSQNTSSLLGSVLRINVDLLPYTIPQSNPFQNEIYLYGLRNPWQGDIDVKTGDIWFGDVGQAAYEEVNVFRYGSDIQTNNNYGWSVMEGLHCYANQKCPVDVPPCGSDLYHNPVLEYGHNNGECTVVGGVFYRGSAIPALYGKFTFGDWCAQKIWAIENKDTVSQSILLGSSPDRPYVFGEDYDGEILIGSDTPNIVKLILAPQVSTSSSPAPDPTASPSPAPMPSASPSPSESPPPPSPSPTVPPSPSPDPSETVEVLVLTSISSALSVADFNEATKLAVFIHLLEENMNEEPTLLGSKVKSAIAIDVPSRRRLLQEQTIDVEIVCVGQGFVQADTILMFYNRQAIKSQGSFEIKVAIEASHSELNGSPVEVVALDANLLDPPAMPELNLVQAYLACSRPVTVLHRQRPAGGAAAAGERVICAAQSGLVYRKEANSSNWVLMLDIGNRVLYSGERGFLGLAVHPDGDRIFVHYTASQGGAGDTVIAAYSWLKDQNGVMDGTIDPNSEVIVFRTSQPYSNHNGGKLLFGMDGLLYIFLGDGGAGGDPFCNGQNKNAPLGSVLRINVDVLPYSIPASNPYDTEIFLYGVRNPWQGDVDVATGDIWFADVGQNLYEEINVFRFGSDIRANNNYGWRVMEGYHCYVASTHNCPDPLEPCNSPAYHNPVFEYDHSNGACSVTGGIFYRGSAIPALYGKYTFGDYCNGRIWYVDNKELASEGPLLAVSTERVYTFGEDFDGEILVGGGAKIWKLVPVPESTTSPSPP